MTRWSLFLQTLSLSLLHHFLGLYYCAAVSGITAYAGSSGNEGCVYRWTVSVQVESNRAWTGTLSGTDNSNPTSEVTVGDSSFYASTKSIDSYSDCTGATVVPDSKNPWTWESNGEEGKQQLHPLPMRNRGLGRWLHRLHVQLLGVPVRTSGGTKG